MRIKLLRPRFYVRQILVLVFLLCLSAPGYRANAKLVGTERDLLNQLLELTLGQPPSRATVRCIADRLPAGAMNNVFIDSDRLLEDDEALSDSLAFRKYVRAAMLCAPTELVTQTTADMPESMSAKQRTCVAKAYMIGAGTNDRLLTVVIRTAMSGSGFGSLTQADQDVVRNSVRTSLRRCVPKSAVEGLVGVLSESFMKPLPSSG
jgi:hypothetical protein